MSASTGITVAGLGRGEARPDIAEIDLGVSVLAPTVSEASAAARDRASAVIDALTRSGLTAEDMATARYAIQPEYDHREGEQRLVGYRVSNDLRITLRQIDTAGEIIDAAVAAGGDAATVNRLAFSLSDETTVRDQARESAWGDALARAEHLARLSGRSLGDVESIVESSGRGTGPPPLARMAMAETTPIEPGSTTISVELEVRFALD
ncbi:MAG: SIMPL domain-containing protein [Acidimicrobiia bacterium]